MRRRSILQTAALMSVAPSIFAQIPAGTGIEKINVQQPVQFPNKEKTIEIRQFFGYWCPHCAHLEPSLDKWLETLPKDVAFVRTPVSFQMAQQIWSQLYFFLDAQPNSAKLHPQIFHALHNSKELNFVTDAKELDAFCVKKFNTKTNAFIEFTQSFSIGPMLSKAKSQQQNFDIRAIPTIAVQGKYRVTPSEFFKAANSMEKGLPIFYAQLNAMIEDERKKV